MKIGNKKCPHIVTQIVKNCWTKGPENVMTLSGVHA